MDISKTDMDSPQASSQEKAGLLFQELCVSMCMCVCEAKRIFDIIAGLFTHSTSFGLVHRLELERANAADCFALDPILGLLHRTKLGLVPFKFSGLTIQEGLTY